MPSRCRCNTWRGETAPIPYPEKMLPLPPMVAFTHTPTPIPSITHLIIINFVGTLRPTPAHLLHYPADHSPPRPISILCRPHVLSFLDCFHEPWQVNVERVDWVRIVYCKRTRSDRGHSLPWVNASELVKKLTTQWCNFIWSMWESCLIIIIIVF